MGTVQLNVRIDEDLKAAGDAVLERHGVSAVQIVREAWRYMAEHQRIPQFDERPAGAPAPIVDIEVESQAGMAIRLAREAGLRAELESMTYTELKESAYEEMLLEEGESRV